MKKDIHPAYHINSKITCVCGASLVAGSTKEEIQVEICSQCHPFFSGKEKVVDTAHRVSGFEKRRAVAAEFQKKKKSSAKNDDKTA